MNGHDAMKPDGIDHSLVVGPSPSNHRTSLAVVAPNAAADSEQIVTPVPAAELVIAAKLTKPPRPRPPPVAGLAVIACHFNPCGFTRPRDNLNRFAGAIADAGVDLYLAELTFEKQSFSAVRASRTFEFRTTSVLWQKERLLNRIIDQLPAAIDKVAWIDADILFDRKCWPRLAAQALANSPAVQLFRSAVLLSADGLPGRVKQGVAYGVKKHGRNAVKRFHPGFAWAARREVLDQCRLYDRLITGGGDAVIARGLLGVPDEAYLRFFSESMQRDIRRWWTAVDRVVGGRVGFVDSRIMHLWHGEQANRQYETRKHCLRDYAFDPERDIALDENGCWRWATEKPRLQAAIQAYFANRREDPQKQP